MQISRIRGQDPRWQILSLRSQEPDWDISYFVVLVGILQLLWLRRQDIVWDTQVLGFRWKNPVWVASNFVASWSRLRLEYFKFCCFMAKIPVGIPQVLWLRGLDIASFVASWSRSRLGYRKFCPFVVKIPLFFTSNFVVSSSRYRLGYLKFWGFVGKIPVGIPQFLCLRK